MGKSDSVIFKHYSSFLDKHLRVIDPQQTALLGFSVHNDFTLSLPPSDYDFYDIQLGNWNIKEPWTLYRNDYDLIVCTRCAYFADPSVFVQRCLEHLKPGGIAFIDWGLGDHWRFSKFQVGWKGEYAIYAGKTQDLVGAVWSDDLESQQASIEFRKLIREHGYDDDRDLGAIIREEVPCYMDLKDASDSLVTTETVLLWPTMPQLYILALFQRSK